MNVINFYECKKFTCSWSANSWFDVLFPTWLVKRMVFSFNYSNDVACIDNMQSRWWAVFNRMLIVILTSLGQYNGMQEWSVSIILTGNPHWIPMLQRFDNEYWPETHSEYPCCKGLHSYIHDCIIICIAWMRTSAPTILLLVICPLQVLLLEKPLV